MNKKSQKDGFELRNRTAIPCIGYGTFKTPDSEVKEAVLQALDVGYRHIDTAAYYDNENGIGQAIAETKVPREEIFVTSKLWNGNRGYENTLRAFDETMNKLKLSRLDLYLIHWPANRKQFGDRAKSLNAETWAAFERLYEEGSIKAIGLSNFLPHHIEELLETAGILPMVDQIEIHPGWLQREAVDYCKTKGILVEAWSPFGARAVLDNPLLLSVAEKHNKTAAQICVRWVLQHGILPLPKTVTKSRMEENLLVFDFSLDEADMAAIDALAPMGKCARPDEVDF